MPNTAELIFKEIDNSQQVGAISQNISGVLYDAEMGPINDPSEVITTSSQFVKTFGAIKADLSNEVAFNSLMRAIDRGTALRVANIKHYTNPDDLTTLDAVFAETETTRDFILSAPLVVGQDITVDVGYQTKTFKVPSNTLAVFDLIFNWLKTDWAVQVNLNGPVLFTKVIDETHFMIVTAKKTNNYNSIDFSFSGVGAPTITTPAGPAEITNQSDEVMFTITPKYPGKKYNDLVVIFEANTYSINFDVTIHLNNSGQPPEVYAGVNLSNVINKINNESKWLKLTPFDTSGYTGWPVLKRTTVFRFAEGSDGGPIVTSDIIGSSISKIGFNAFDGYDDIARIGNFIGENNFDVDEAGSSYANGRKDLVYFMVLANQGASTLINWRNATSINDSFTRIYSAGTGIVVKNRNGTGNITITPLGDLLGIAADSASKYGPWYSYANSNRGSLNNVMGAGNKWGAAGNAKDLQLLALNQINAIITQDKATMVWGNFTAQPNESLLSYNSIRDLVIYIEKSLRPTLRPFLEEPNDIPTWIHIYNAIHPFFDGLETKRALQSRADNGWNWRGDQNAASMRELKVNNFADVQQGKYLVMLDLKPVNSLQQFTLAISLNSSDSSIAITEL